MLRPKPFPLAVECMSCYILAQEIASESRILGYRLMTASSVIQGIPQSIQKYLLLVSGAESG